MHFLDATSRIYDISKDKITKFQKLVNVSCDVVPIFYNHLSSKLYIKEVGKKLLLGLYSRNNIGSLNKVRHKISVENFAKTSVVKPE